MTTREDCYQALFDRIRPIAPFQIAERRLQHWRDLIDQGQSGTSPFPALCVVAANNKRLPARREGFPATWEYDAKVYLYFYDASPGAVVETQRSNALDALEAALAPDYSGRQTLGGRVRDAFIADEIVTDEGTLGELALAIVTVRMLNAL